MIKITTLLDEILKPLGFKRQSASWTKYRRPLLVRVSYYSSRWGGPGYIDLAFTVSDIEISKQNAGEWDAAERIVNLIPSGKEIEEIIKKEVTPEEAAKLKTILKMEAGPLIGRVVDPKQAFKLVKEHPTFLSGDHFLKKLAEHLRQPRTAE
jgi:hypothetical protein